MAYFIGEIVSKSIFIHEDDEVAIEKYKQAEIPVLTVPNPGPFDPVVLAVLVTKFNSIMEDTLIITDAELMSQAGGFLTYVWDASDDDDDIHELVNDEDECKWWAVASPRFISYDEGSDVEAIDEEYPFPIQWNMVDLQWSDDIDDGDLEVDFILDPNADFKQDEDNTVIKISDFTKPKKK
jgi:hypothetical protein